MHRAAFDLAVQTALMSTLRSVGDGCVESVMALLGEGHGKPVEGLASYLPDIDRALDELFPRFSRIIKHTTILQVCSSLRVDPPALGNSLFWMVEELRSTLWKDPT